MKNIIYIIGVVYLIFWGLYKSGILSKDDTSIQEQRDNSLLIQKEIVEEFFKDGRLSTKFGSGIDYLDVINIEAESIDDVNKKVYVSVNLTDSIAYDLMENSSLSHVSNFAYAVCPGPLSYIWKKLDDTTTLYVNGMYKREVIITVPCAEK